MSLISDALKKAESSPDSRRKESARFPFQPPVPPPKSNDRILLLALVACTGLVLLGISRVTRPPETSVAPPPVSEQAPVLPAPIPAPPPATHETAVTAAEAPAPTGATEPIPTATETSSAPSAPQPVLPPAENPAGKHLLQAAQGEMRLNGIMLSGDGKPLALINRQVLQPGDRTRGMTVVRVDMDSVELRDKNGETKILKLKQGEN